MSGRLIITTKKSYCPWNPRNVERILRDERLERERSEGERADREDATSRGRIEGLKRRRLDDGSRGNVGDALGADRDGRNGSGRDGGGGAVGRHVNLFEAEEKDMARKIAEGELLAGLGGGGGQRAESKGRHGVMPVYLGGEEAVRRRVAAEGDDAPFWARRERRKRGSEEARKDRMDPMRSFDSSFAVDGGAETGGATGAECTSPTPAGGKALPVAMAQTDGLWGRAERAGNGGGGQRLRREEGTEPRWRGSTSSSDGSGNGNSSSYSHEFSSSEESSRSFSRKRQERRRRGRRRKKTRYRSRSVGCRGSSGYKEGEKGRKRQRRSRYVSSHGSSGSGESDGSSEGKRHSRDRRRDNSRRHGSDRGKQGRISGGRCRGADRDSGSHRDRSGRGGGDEDGSRGAEQDEWEEIRRRRAERERLEAVRESGVREGHTTMMGDERERQYQDQYNPGLSRR